MVSSKERLTYVQAVMDSDDPIDPATTPDRPPVAPDRVAAAAVALGEHFGWWSDPVLSPEMAVEYAEIVAATLDRSSSGEHGPAGATGSADPAGPPPDIVLTVRIPGSVTSKIVQEWLADNPGKTHAEAWRHEIQRTVGGWPTVEIQDP